MGTSASSNASNQQVDNPYIKSTHQKGMGLWAESDFMRDVERCVYSSARSQGMSQTDEAGFIALFESCLEKAIANDPEAYQLQNTAPRGKSPSTWMFSPPSYDFSTDENLLVKRYKALAKAA